MKYEQYHKFYNKTFMRSITGRIHVSIADAWLERCAWASISSHAAICAFVCYVVGESVAGKEKYEIAKIRLAKLLDA